MALENLGETFLTVAQNQNLELVTLILEVTGPDIVHSRSIPGETALHLSIAFVSRDNTEVMEFLLASGANVNAVDTNGCTPLFWTTTFSRPERVKVLLAAGAHVNLWNNNGRTPLDNALAEGYGSDEGS